MKTTVKVTKSGAVTIPAFIRRRENVAPGDIFELSADGEVIEFTRIIDKCIYCGDTKGLENVLGKCICSRCYKKLVKEVK